MTWIDEVCDERFNRLVGFTDMLSDATSPLGIIGGLIKRTAGARWTDQIATTSSIARTALVLRAWARQAINAGQMLQTAFACAMRSLRVAVRAA
jgi:hypothetical protein